MATITIVHALNIKPVVKLEPSVFAPANYAYIIPDKTDLITMARSIHQAEREKNDWIRKYDNLMRGLNFWKDKALSK